MLKTKEEFTIRVNELNDFLNALKQIDINIRNGKTDEVFNDVFFKILKSNAVLMVYNIIELSIVNSFDEIYMAIQKGIDYKKARKEIQSIWLNRMYKNAYDVEAHWNTGRDIAQKILDSVIKQEKLKLDRKAMGVQGNIDAEEVRKICNNHGIELKISTAAKGGTILKYIKDKRNELAHGTFSFSEACRDKTLDELLNIKEEALQFVSDCLDSIEIYIDGEKYMQKAQ